MILQLNYALYFAMDTESFVRQGGDVFFLCWFVCQQYYLTSYG